MTSIELRNLTVAGPGDRPLLDNISLTVPSGETLAIIGPSGAGKSLLLRVIVGLDEQTSGQVLLDDLDTSRSNPRTRDLAMVFQDYALHPQLDAFDNLAFSSTLRREKSTSRFRRGRLDKIAITERVNSVSEFLALTDLLELKPADL
ncbi:MAG: ATP-binding cassette domain-containing protein, partial [Aeromicrobium sp.]